MASWSPPPGDRDGFQLWLYRLRPLTLESRETLPPEAQNFSWARLSPGTEFLVQLATLRGPDESSRANATGWTRECHPHTPHTPFSLATLAGRTPRKLCALLDVFVPPRDHVTSDRPEKKLERALA